MGLVLVFFAAFFAFTTAHCHVDYPMDKARITQLLGGPGNVGPVKLTPATTLSAMQRICNQFNGCSDWNSTLASVVTHSNGQARGAMNGAIPRQSWRRRHTENR